MYLTLSLKNQLKLHLLINRYVTKDISQCRKVVKLVLSKQELPPLLARVLYSALEIGLTIQGNFEFVIISEANVNQDINPSLVR